MITVADVVPAFLAACPSIEPAWQEHLAFWGDTLDRGAYNDAAVVAHHIVSSFERGDVSEFAAVFALLERCFTEGDEEVRNLASVGFIEDIQNIASHTAFGPSVFYEWLGSASRAAWDDLCVFWEQVREAKAAGLLDPKPGESERPAIDMSQVQDPTLRSLMKQIYRK